jgi:biotin carboxyl carrier protein
MRRDLIVTAGDRDVEVAVESQEECRLRLTIDGRERLVEARRVRPGTWSILLDGRSYVVDFDDRKRGTVALAGGSETPLGVEDARRRRLALAARRDDVAAAGERIDAPIAGKVVKILVEQGDGVAAGQGVCVLEAMKMENEIKADRGGTVVELHVSPGQSVDTGEPLVTLS